MKILVTGSTGLLGQELCPLLEKEGHQFWATNSKIFDITNDKLAKEITNKISLDLIIHLAAYTNADMAEINKEDALKVNVQGTKNMAKIAKHLDVPIIYISTDNVFDGEKSTPYKTNDKANPINVLGYSKLKGEEEIRKHTKKHYILRTGTLFGQGKDYVNSMITFSMFNSSISVVDDQILSPTWTYDLSKEIINIINDKRPYGTYHIANSGQTNWTDFTKKIFEIKKRNISVAPIENSDFPRPAKRPKYAVLDSNVTLPDWEESLEKYLLAK